MTAFNGAEFAKSLATEPGVYVMRGSENEVLYVGKAKNLRRRVASYFNGQDKGGRINLLIRKIASMEVSLTRTETEALLLENEWIKAYRPKFNISLRDDKSYPWIRLNSEHAFPSVSFYRGRRRKKGEFFGPYSSIGAVRESLHQIYRLFKLRQCRDSVFKNRTRPCLQYQIKRCSAPCVGYISPEAYDADVEATRQLLKGNNDEVIGLLIERMNQASESQDYEQAAIFRDHIQSFQTVRSQQYVIGTQEDMDILGIASQASQVIVHVISFRNGRNVGGQSLFLRNVGPEDGAGVLIGAFLGQYYQQRRPPTQILVSVEPSEALLWIEALSEKRGRRVDLKWRVRGARAKWLDLAQKNAEDRLRRHLADRDQWGQGLLALSALLKLDEPPSHIECFDISHSSGEGTMGSVVVFGPEGPRKRNYRLYGVEGITPGDDYAAMSQVIQRRYARALKEQQPLPDLVLIDGGEGQLKRAEAVFIELGLDWIPVVGVAKGRARKAGHERLIMNGSEVVPGPHHAASHVIQRIRDEAHRFAVQAHRKRRQKRSHQSLLDGIPGVGPVKKKRLLEHFGGQDGLMKASVEDLERIHGIGAELAQLIHGNLQPQSGNRVN